MITRRAKAFAAFAYDFVIGDDWSIAVGVVLVLALTYWLTHSGHRGVWWLLLVAVVVLLPFSLWRALRRR